MFTYVPERLSVQITIFFFVLFCILVFIKLLMPEILKTMTMLKPSQIHKCYVAFLSGYEFTTRLESRACEIKAVFSIGLIRNGVSWVRILLQY